MVRGCHGVDDMFSDVALRCAVRAVCCVGYVLSVLAIFGYVLCFVL